MIKTSTAAKIIRIAILLLLVIIFSISYNTIKAMHVNTFSNNSSFFDYSQYTNKDKTITFNVDTKTTGTYIDISNEDKGRYVTDFNYEIKEGVIFCTGIYDPTWNLNFTILNELMLYTPEENFTLYPVNGHIKI